MIAGIGKSVVVRGIYAGNYGRNTVKQASTPTLLQENDSSRCIRQYSRMLGVSGTLEKKHQMEMIGIIANVAQTIRKVGTFDPEAIANAASYDLKVALRKRGVELTDALKGMQLVMGCPSTT